MPSEKPAYASGILTSLVLLTAITIPLAIIFVDAVQTYQAEQVIERVINEQLEPYTEIALVDFEQSTKTGIS